MRRHVLKGFGIALAMVATLALVACGVRAADKAQASSDTPQSTVTVTLSGNAGTGYSWEYANDAEGTLSLTSHDSEDASDEQLDGGPTVDTFVFEAKEAGTVHLSFTYERPWEPASEPTFSCTIGVDDDLNATISDFTGPDEYRGCVKVS